MRVAMYYNNHDVRLEELPVPQIGPGELLVRIEASGICGSDVMEWYRRGRGSQVLGHEVAGEIVQVGQEISRFKPGDRVAVITVADTGPGIPGQDLPRIFEPFFSTKETGKGVGLGLAICHSIIEELGGSITVQSRAGLGTTVCILLPPDGVPVLEASSHAV